MGAPNSWGGLRSVIEFTEQFVPQERECNEPGTAEDECCPQKVTFPRADQGRQRKYHED